MQEMRQVTSLLFVELRKCPSVIMIWGCFGLMYAVLYAMMCKEIKSYTSTQICNERGSHFFSDTNL